MSSPSSQSSTKNTIHLQGRSQVAARTIALALIAFAVGTFILTNLSIVQFRLEEANTHFAEALAQIQLSPVVYAFYLPTLQGLAVLVNLIVALIIVSRRPDEPIALLVAVTLVTFSSANLYHNPRIAATMPILWYAQAVNILVALTVDSLVIFFFPDGRLYPRWMRWVLIPSLLLHPITAGYFLSSDVSSPDSILVFSLEVIFVAIGIGGQLLRYRRVLKPEQRQQTKWILAGFQFVTFALGTFLLVFAVLTPRIGEQSVERLLLNMTVDDALHFLSLLVLGLTIMNAILRRRLWDIDFAVNRALGIGAALISSVLVVVALTALLNTFIPPIPAVLVAVIVGGLVFIPARTFFQRFIDMHLYGLRQPIADYQTVVAPEPKPTVSQPGMFSGRTLDGIELLDFVARGGMGEVYKGYTGGSVYAVKVLRSDQNEEQTLRFIQEAEALRRIQHPNIVRLQRFGMADGLHYLAMDYLEGETLRTYLLQKPQMPLADVHTVIADLANALDHVHALGIIHRDLKPGNIMLSLNEAQAPTRAILLDFGIARIVEMAITQTGMGSVGTIEYIAPEQILSSHNVTPAADVYALGVMVYEMLTGQRPFKGNQGQVLFAHLKQPAPDPRVILPDLSMDISFAVRRAMSKEPEDRFASAGEFAQALTDTAGATSRMIQFH